MKKQRQFKRKFKKIAKIIWQETPRAILLLIGSFLLAFGYVMFQVPFNIVAGGLSGLALIINSFTGWPIGVMYWVMNIPMFILGFIHLGRWSFLIRTIIAVTIFSFLIDWLQIILPPLITPYPVTDNLLLATIYGGIIGGIGSGLLYRAGGTVGGTSIIGRILQNKTGLPLSQTYFFTDGIIILLAGIVFGWEIALYGLLMMFISGLASDYTLEGPSTTRVASIITNLPQEVSDALLTELGRGVSYWEVTGAYTGKQHYMLTCTVSRPQVSQVRHVISGADPDAFVTISMGHNALGEGFGRLR
ncbi:MAG: YitT family protein [Anaerolineae bacterium]|nr:YitT family protein [Anaerolineae bacterium]